MASQDSMDNEQEAHEERKRVYLAASFGTPCEKVLGRLIKECRAFIYFLLILIIITLIEAFSPVPLMLVQGAQKTLLDVPLPSGVSATSRKFADVESTSDINLYLQNTLYSAVYSSTDSGTLNQVNSVLGGVRIRQLRRQAKTCSSTLGTIGSFSSVSFDCYEPFASDNEDTAAFGSTSQYTWTSAKANGAELMDTEATTLSVTTLQKYGGSGYVKLLSTNRVTALAELQSLDTGGFYDKNTVVVFVEFSTYNPSVNQFLSVQLMFERVSSGLFVPQANIQAFSLFQITYESSKNVVVGSLYVLYALYILYFVAMELADMFLEPNMAQTLADVPPEDYRPVPPWKRPFYYFFKLTFIWELLHILNIVVMVLGVSIWVQFMLSDEVSNYDIHLTLTTWANHYPFADYTDTIRFLSALNVFLSIFKLFKYMQLSVRLNILWLTLILARPFLIGFTLMFLLVFLGFSLTGFVLFGVREHQFSTAFFSIRSLFGFLMGDFNYAEMKAQSPTLAPLFFYGFLIIVLFVMLNIFIAILNNSFNDVSSTISTMKFKPSVTATALLFGSKVEHCITERCSSVQVEQSHSRDPKAPQAEGSEAEAQEGTPEQSEPKFEEPRASSLGIFALCASKQADQQSVLDPVGETACPACGKEPEGDSLLRCGGCKMVFYCSEACQQAHWEAGHQDTCKASIDE